MKLQLRWVILSGRGEKSELFGGAHTFWDDIMVATVWRRKDNWVGAAIDDAVVMLDFECGTYVSLNKTATDVWDALEQPRSIEQIVNMLSERYDVTQDQCSQAVHRLLNDFRNEGLIEQVG